MTATGQQAGPADTPAEAGTAGAGGRRGGGGGVREAGRQVGEAARAVWEARRRAHERNPSLLEVHDLRGLRGSALDSYIERIRPPGGRTMVPWLLIAIAPGSDIVRGRVHPEWLGWILLVLFCALYTATVMLGTRDDARRGPAVWALLGAQTALTFATAMAWGHNWLLTFIMLALACGTVLRGRALALLLAVLSTSDGLIAGHGRHDAWLPVSTGYGTFLAGMMTATVLSLHEVIGTLRAARQDLARNAVSAERLRFSRDLHDLLGHTMSVVAVKAEAVRRLAPRNVEAALEQAADIEAVARQALTEIREAVTGYREGSLPAELERARSALDASGIALEVSRSGPPVDPGTEALLGWVVREGVTNVVRHSGASSCRIEVGTGEGHALLEITDDGPGPGTGGTGGGTGLTGLAERLAMAGGELTRGPLPRGGFRLAARLPVDDGGADPAADGVGDHGGRGDGERRRGRRDG